MIITVLSKVVGFIREIALSYVYGASAITDAYLIAQTIPTTIFSFVSAGVATGFIPMYSRIRQENGIAGADSFTSNLSNLLLLISTIVVALVLSFTPWVVKLFASGFSGETLALAVVFTRITVFGVYFTAVLSVCTGYLRIHERYWVAALVGFPMNLITICSLFLSTKTSIYVVALGSLLATASQLIFLTPFLCKLGYRHQPVLTLNDTYLKEMFFLAFPVILGTSVNEINVLVDRTMASSVVVGGISALNYARRLNTFVQGLVVTSLTTVMYPVISKMAAENNMEGLKRKTTEAMSAVVLLILPPAWGPCSLRRKS